MNTDNQTFQDFYEEVLSMVREDFPNASLDRDTVRIDYDMDLSARESADSFLKDWED